MSDPALHQRDLELDFFWNELIAGRFPSTHGRTELETVEKIVLASAVPLPPASVFDSIWADVIASEVVPDRPVSAGFPIPIRVPEPRRTIVPVVSQRRRSPWARVAVAMAALLIVAAAAGVFVDRQRDSGFDVPAAAWAMAGGDPGQTRGNADGAFLVDPGIRWQVDTNGRVDTTPVLADGVVYVGNQEQRVDAIDEATGLQRWNVNLRKPVTTAAAVAGDLLTIGTTTTLFGLSSESGTTIWQRKDVVAASDPIILDGIVYLVDRDRRVRALDSATGDDVWTSEPFDSEPSIAIDSSGGSVIVATADGVIEALELEDGTQRWRVTPGLGTLGAPLVDGGWIAVPIQGGVVRIRSANGEIGPKNRSPFQAVPALALVGERLVAVTNEIVVSYDWETLELEWSNQLLPGASGSVTMSDASIYLPMNDRSLVALDPTTGEVQWRRLLDDVAATAPVVGSDQLLVATRTGSVYALAVGAASIVNAPVIDGSDSSGAVAQVLWRSYGGPQPLGNPTSIAVSPTGEVWVCDTANDRLQVFDGDGSFLRSFGSHGTEPGRFDFGEETAEMEGYALLGNACSVAFDANGSLYVADAGNFRVQRFPASALRWMVHACCTIENDGTVFPYPTSGATPDLIIEAEGASDGQFLFPAFVAVGPSGDIYVGDRLRLDVQRFDSSGQYIETIGEPVTSDPFAPATFSSVDGVTVDGLGQLSIADGNAKEIHRQAPDGTWTVIQISHRDYRINGIAVDDQGNLYVTQIDPIGGSFAVYAADGRPLVTVGTYGNALGQFDGTSGLALDDEGNVYVSDWALNRIQKFAVDQAALDALVDDSG